VLATVLAIACGDSGTGGPSSVSQDDRVYGVWIGKATLTQVGGGECVGATLQAAVGARDLFTASIRQDRATLAATIAYQGNSTSCALGGTAGNGGVSLELTSCHAGRVERFRCSNGDLRDLEILSGRLSAAAQHGTGIGRDVTVWNVFATGSRTPLATLTTTAEFRWNLSRLPHDDFHIFDGSIMPGYVDGVVTIPEEPDPFCTACGWLAR
jgi:hypothetical protein